MPRPARTIGQIITFIVETLAFTELFRVGGAWAEIRLGFEMNALMQHKPLPKLFPLLKMHISPTLDYVADGLVFSGALLVLILLFLALRKRLRPWALLALLAFVLAFAYSVYAHSGFVPLSNS